MLEFKIRSGQNLQLIGKPVVASDTRNQLKAHFDVTADYQGILTAYWTVKHTDTVYASVLDDDHICTVPWEVLVSQDTGYGSDISHRVGVSLAAGDRLTTDTCWITILRSTYNDTASGGSVPTPTKWDQINSQIVNMDYKNESVYCWGGQSYLWRRWQY